MGRRPGPQPTERGLIVRELLEKFPDAPSRTLAQKLYKDYPEWFPTLETARGSVRYYRGQYGKKQRCNATHQTKPGKAGWKPQMPPSEADPWTPFVLSTPCRVASLSDIHIPYHDQKAVEAAVKKCKKLNPNVVLLNGDTADFYTISRWTKNPKKRNLGKEITAQRSFLLYLVHEFPKAKIVFKFGNHEERWDHFIWNKAPELFDLPQVRLDQVLTRDDDNEPIHDLAGIEWVKDQRPILAGHLPVFHGHELPKGISNPVNAARGAFLRVVHTTLIGHLHRSSSHAEPNLWHEEIATWSQGCLCDLRPEYARINKWNHGFAFIDVSKDSEFEVTNYRIIDGKVRQS